MRPIAMLVAAALVFTTPAAAQAPAPERDAILKAVQTTFDGMRTHDTVLLKQAVLADAGFMTVGKDREGKSRIRRTNGQEFIDAVGKGGEPWNETLHEPIVMQDGDLAAVWGYFSFKLGDKPSHCGYDLFTLAKMEGQWKVVAIADTQRREGCKF